MSDLNDEKIDPKLEELIPKDVYTLLKYFIATLSQQAWVFMGFQMNPLTGGITKDLKQARLAIDTASAIVEKLSQFVDEKEVKEYQTIIQTMQMNFVQQSNSQ